MQDDYNSDYRRKIREANRRRRKREVMRNRIIFAAVCAVIVIVIILLVRTAMKGKKPDEGVTSAPAQTQETQEGETAAPETAEDGTPVTSAGTEGQTAEGETTSAAPADGVAAQAAHLAAQYDYDGAIAMLQAAPGGAEAYASQISEYESIKSTLVEQDITQIPHIFFHSLIVDTSKAFGQDEFRRDDYNRVMTTVSEFNAMMDQMYERGYVLVSMHQMAEYHPLEDGGYEMVRGKIMLPEGKKPFVLSVDDVSYYAYMMRDGFATKLITDENGRLTNEMEMGDGTVQTGSFDVLPLLDDFVDAHPDFSYKGAKGILAMTGYDGLFGYRTDIDYKLKEHLLSNQQEWLDAHPDFDYDTDCAEAARIAQAIRDDGWEFATHSWGHRDMRDSSMENFVTDMNKWIDRVESIIGDTDICIYPFGTDMGTAAPYTDDFEKYAWMTNNGFHYFCNVDSAQPWVQFTDRYLRQARIDADGYMMYYHPENLSAFFDVDSVFDQSRPLPVPDYS